MENDEQEESAILEAVRKLTEMCGRLSTDEIVQMVEQ